MKWNPNEPITPGYYLCAALGYDRPIMLCWYPDKKQWGEWTHGEYDDGILQWEPFEKSEVKYHMGLNEISMPEGWV
jgi:hypothetical protein